jgi:predicted glycosyltransferase
MRILVDINHPAHVHYFKNFIRIMKMKGHEFLVTARNKEIAFDLLKQNEIEYHDRGAGKKSLLAKLFYILKADIYIFKKALKFKPDLFLSFASTYAAHASALYRKPHIALDDTEHAKFELLMYPPFTNIILTPYCFKKDLGKKQIRFDSFVELSYLHPNQFKPDPNVLDLLGVKADERFAIVRFVSWNASHDIGEKGLSNNEKINLVEELSKKVKVFVSSEGLLPAPLKKHEFKVPTNLMHSALFYASIYVGEGGTTASEAALLGTPALYINNLSMGYIDEEKKAGLLFQTTDKQEIFNKIHAILNENKNSFKNNLAGLMESKTDLTAYLVWFVENYPASVKQLSEDKNFQKRFV